jgi:hypothetical protein
MNSFEIDTAKAVERFCSSCVSFHEDRAKFFPGEASELVPPACYFHGHVMRPGWCQGARYQEPIIP